MGGSVLFKMAWAHAGAAVAIEEDSRERRTTQEPSQAPCSHVGVTIRHRTRALRSVHARSPAAPAARRSVVPCADGS